MTGRQTGIPKAYLGFLDRQFRCRRNSCGEDMVALVAARRAQADSIVYDVSGAFSGTATSLTGTVMFDSTTGLVTSASLSTTGSVPLGPFTFVLIQHPVKGNPSLDTVGIFDAS